MPASNDACDCCAKPYHDEPKLAYEDPGYCGEINPEDGLAYPIVTTTHIDGHVSITTYTLNEETGECESSTVCEPIVITTTYSLDGPSTWTYSGPDPLEPNDTVSGGGSQSISGTDTVTYAEDCSSTAAYTGTASYNDTSTNHKPWGDSISAQISCSWSRNADTGEWNLVSSSGSVTYTYDDGTSETETSNNPTCNLPPYTSVTDPEPLDEEEVEYSGDPVNPHRRLYHVGHQATGTCYLKVWIRKTINTGGQITHDDSQTYEWNGTGNPCLPDPNKSVEDEANRIEGEPFEVEMQYNTTDGQGQSVVAYVEAVEILKYSCVPGYEPDISDEENPQPNGFPDPLWEAAAP